MSDILPGLNVLTPQTYLSRFSATSPLSSNIISQRRHFLMVNQKHVIHLAISTRRLFFESKVSIFEHRLCNELQGWWMPGCLCGCLCLSLCVYCSLCILVVRLPVLLYVSLSASVALHFWTELAILSQSIVKLSTRMSNAPVINTEKWPQRPVSSFTINLPSWHLAGFDGWYQIQWDCNTD